MKIPLLSYIIWLPLLGAILTLFIPKKAKITLTLFSLLITITDFILSLYLWKKFSFKGGFQFIEKREWIASLGINYILGVDGISLFLVILTAFLMPIVILSSYTFIKERYKEYIFSFLILETTILGTFLSLDLFLFFIFWELVLVPMYIIIGVWGGERRIYATVKFFLYTMTGSIFLLLSILYLGIEYHSLTDNYSFSYFELKRMILPLRTQLLLFLGFSFAFAIKVPLVPFHTWLPPAHVEAPTGGSVILAGVLLKMGAYGFIRYSFGLFPYIAYLLKEELGGLAVASIILGGLFALRQNNIKRLVAYSSIAHLGFVILGIVAFETKAMVGGVYQMINHGITISALFLLVGIIYERKHKLTVENFGGLAKPMPNYATLFFIAGLSAIGLPGLNNFVGEFLVLLGTFQSKILNYGKLFVIITVLSLVISAVYILDIYMKIFFGKVKKRDKTLKDLTIREFCYMLPLISLIIIMGIFPSLFLNSIRPSIEKFYTDFITTTKEIDRECKVRLEDGRKVIDYNLPLKKLRKKL